MKAFAFFFVTVGIVLNVVNAVTAKTPDEALAWAAAASWAAFALVVMAALMATEHADGD